MEKFIRFWNAFLIGPDGGGELKYDKESNVLQDIVNGHDYNIVENVPVMWPKINHVDIGRHPLHEKHKTEFNYLEHYENDAEEFDYTDANINPAYNIENKRLHQVILSKLPKHAKNILDVGCGGAWVAQKFQKSDKEVCSMDISTANPVKALKRFSCKGHWAITADVYHLPFKPNTFDVIIASEIMEHTINPQLFIEKLIMALKPGGKLIVTTPYNEKIEYTLCVHCNKPTPLSAHLHSFNIQNFTPVLKNIDGIKYSYKLFGNKYLAKLKLNSVFSFLGFRFWKTTDHIFNIVLKYPTRFLIEIDKVM